GATPLTESARTEHQLQRIRNGRYIGEIHHEMGANRRASDVLLPLANGVTQIHTQRLEGRDLLERAYFHQLHGCVRVRLAVAMGAQNPAEGVAEGSIGRARADYKELLWQLDPGNRRWWIRVWRWVRGSDRTDGTMSLRKQASEGSEQLEFIEKGNG